MTEKEIQEVLIVGAGSIGRVNKAFFFF